MYRSRCFSVCMSVAIAFLLLAPTIAQAQGTRRAERPYPRQPDQLHGRAADDVLAQIWAAAPGGAKFTAIDAVAKKYKESDAQTKNAIDWLSLYYMRDKNRNALDRWPCIYVLQNVECKLAIPWIIDELLLDRVEAMRAVAAEALGKWYKSSGDKTILAALKQSQQADRSKWVQEILEKYLNDAVIIAPDPGNPDESHRKAAEKILKQIWDAEPGGPKFVAIDAVVTKYKQSDSKTQQAITWLCITYMKDRARGTIDRWPCIYVLSRLTYQPALADMIDVLLNEKIEIMRAVAAEALGQWWKKSANNEVFEALIQSAKTDTSSQVRETIAKYLGDKMPAPGQ